MPQASPKTDISALALEASLADLGLEATLTEIKGAGWDAEIGTLEHSALMDTHITSLFPEATNETVTFVAGGTNNVFGSWAEIADNNAVKFSTKFATHSGHISAFQIEEADTTDKVYIFEMSYGSSKTIIARYRFISGAQSKLPAIQQVRVRSIVVPKGEDLYYRMACETADAECVLSMRYYPHTS